MQIAKWGFQASLTGSKTFKASSKERGQKHLEPPLLCVDGGHTSLHCKLNTEYQPSRGGGNFLRSTPMILIEAKSGTSQHLHNHPGRLPTSEDSIFSLCFLYQSPIHCPKYFMQNFYKSPAKLRTHKQFQYKCPTSRS